ncbi:unnamed protein product [Gongylonema pulchrum]|uniref:Lysosomal amino acid transporter 1 homolog n=1 Tax=Gongylonema pulchrum TaxID=637853 RepID=A0A183CWX9_9BILA|nr:unnamed protein product [Gongylonema pulchrum]
MASSLLHTTSHSDGKDGTLSSNDGQLQRSTCPDGVKWIMDIFEDCVDTDLKLIGFSIGFVSLFLWFLPLIPQVIKNYRIKRCEGLSVYFLLFWLTGDTCNMVGAMLANQQPIQKILGVYYVVQDLLVLSQYFYYSHIYKRRSKGFFFSKNPFEEAN